MMQCKWGDVVIVEMPFSEGKGTKKRPALVISSDEYHKSRQEVVITAITTNLDRVLVGDTKLDEWQKAGLKYPSLVAGIIQTVKRSLIIHKVGSLTQKDFRRVQRNLGQAIRL